MTSIKDTFKNKGFQDWAKKLHDMGAKISVSVKFNTGEYAHFGSSDIGSEVSRRVSEKLKRNSREWIKNPCNLKKLNIPLSYMKQKNVRYEAPFILKHFQGENSKNGVGDSFFWSHKVNVKNLPISAKALKFESEMISLSDFIEWKDFTVNTFGVMPPSHLFKRKVAWPQFLRLMIKKAYAILDVDPETHVI